ncbi:unknown [Candidatus Apopatosoma intestinale]|nr:unknown [Candidatus Apopatosoma intestinale]
MLIKHLVKSGEPAVHGISQGKNAVCTVAVGNGFAGKRKAVAICRHRTENISCKAFKSFARLDIAHKGYLPVLWR